MSSSEGDVQRARTALENPFLGIYTGLMAHPVGRKRTALTATVLALLVSGAMASPALGQTRAAEAAAAKDWWDKIDAVSGLASGLVVALIGAAATYLYNERQRARQEADRQREFRLLEVQTVATFLPHLNTGDSAEREAALVAMSALGNTQLVTRLAAIYRDEASLGALSRIAAGGDRAAASAAESSLEELLRSAVVQIGDDEQWSANGFAVAGGIVVTADYVTEYLTTPTVRGIEGAWRAAEVVGTAQAYGIGVLKVTNPGLVPLPLLEIEPGLEALGELTMLGSTQSGWRVSVGRIVDRQTLPDMKPEVDFWVATLVVEQGSGGAPVIDRAGRVVAMVYAASGRTDEAQEALLPASAIRAGLASLGATGL